MPKSDAPSARPPFVNVDGVGDVPARKLLAALEARFESAISFRPPKRRASIGEVREALKKIRDGRLYREKYNSFEEYCLFEFALTPLSVGKILDSTTPAVAASEPKRRPTRVVYFVRAGSFVKIGATSNLAMRVASIKTCCPFSVCFVGAIPGGEDTERRLHTELKESQSHGEWFHDNEAVRAAISRELDRDGEDRIHST